MARIKVDDIVCKDCSLPLKKDTKKYDGSIGEEVYLCESCKQLVEERRNWDAS